LEHLRLQLPLIRENSINGSIYIGIQNFSLNNANSDTRIGAGIIIDSWNINGKVIDFNFKIENGIIHDERLRKPEVLFFLKYGF
jgi:hypothetical protein